MGIKPCVDSSMIATVRGMGMARAWIPRVIAEAFLESTKDGEISRAPDPVTMIEGDLSWYNATKHPQYVYVDVMRAPRSIVAQSPGTVDIHEAWSIAVGESPAADFPSVTQNSTGGSAQIDRAEVEADKLQYGRLFFDFDSGQVNVPIGVVAPGDSFHFRYLCAVQTPGTWTTPSEFEPRWEAYARWARLVAVAGPPGSV